ncbi:hypothetical protein SDRG_14304 [Saprolegnia diclina VS20]|uniref:KIF-binding protein n=1 Tax=Saprolegnia diclina (strain VS20) TaxID=1156394 RepID=T0R760_SAPDV|nr:hypothetical protein SDRG_14304 [Saprolegnia diclina VS20]EQC27883.1 hypothetical protein SDRG_14304 [Saprolegnia diclina VS20]|eukprot:XP_008618648.1 hypothetical protein SDRG_14304 [Saprolegnia diclina VS20]
MKDVLAEAKRLMAAGAVDAHQPYEHLYEARTQLLAATAQTPQDQLLRLSLLGQIAMAVEEPHEAQPCLEKALAVLPASAPLLAYVAGLAPDAAASTVPTALPSPSHLVPANINVDLVDVVELLNQLGILWCHRSQHAKALSYLTTADALCANDADTDMLLGSAHTHTMFYLAQVYGHVGDAAASAHFCQQTLRRQLQAAGPLTDELPPDWVKNCLGLATFYTTTHAAATAIECVLACKHVTPTNVDDDVRGRIALVEAKIYMNVLQRPPNEPSPPPTPLFPSLPHPASANDLWPLASPITSLDDARPLFRRAMACLDAAKDVFVLDGHVTDHIRVLQLQSCAYARLLPYEPDRKRQMAMLTRRLSYLTPLLFHPDGADAVDLNRNAFGYLVQELLFEAADVYGALHDLKCLHLSKAYAQTNSYGHDGIRCYTRFLQLYYFQQGTDARSEIDVPLPRPLRRPTHLSSDEDLLPFFTGVFYLARLYGKLQFLDAAATVQAWSESLRLHESVVALTASASCFQAERAISLEMTQLLPEKINRAHFGSR